MGIHHIAFACADTEATHRFYSEAMGFRLAKVEAVPSPEPPGWAKHLFYDTGGGGMIAFWELHDEKMAGLNPAISTGLGFEAWVNHLAFDAVDRAGLEVAKQRWLDHGHDVAEIDHDWCVSIYTMDPNGNLVEWSYSTRAFTDDDERQALEALAAESPTLLEPKGMQFFKAPARAPA